MSKAYIANIKENPQMAVICLYSAPRQGCRIWARGDIINSGELFDKTVAEFSARSMKVKNVVKVAIEEVETF